MGRRDLNLRREDRKNPTRGVRDDNWLKGKWRVGTLERFPRGHWWLTQPRITLNFGLQSSHQTTSCRWDTHHPQRSNPWTWLACDLAHLCAVWAKLMKSLSCEVLFFSYWALVSKRKSLEVTYPIASGNAHVEEHVSVQINFHRQPSSTEAVPDKTCISALLVDRWYQPASGNVTSRFSVFLFGLLHILGLQGWVTGIQLSSRLSAFANLCSNLKISHLAHSQWALQALWGPYGALVCADSFQDLGTPRHRKCFA